MRVIPDQKLKEQLTKNGMSKLCKGFDINYDDYSRFMREVEMLHPRYSTEAKHRWAAYSSIFYNKKYTKPKRSIGSTILLWLVISIIVILSAIVTISLLTNKAFAQGTSQIDVIQWQDSDGNKLKTYAAPFKIRCGEDFTCTPQAGSRMDLDLTGWNGILRNFDISKLEDLGLSIELWLRADTGITMDSSNRISKWEDQSGNDRDYEQSTAADQPLFVSTSSDFGDQPVVRFDSSNTEWLKYEDTGWMWGNGYPKLVIAVFKLNSSVTTSGGMFSVNEGNTSRLDMVYGHSDNTIIHQFMFGGSSYLQKVGHATTSVSNPFIHALWTDTTGQYADLRVDGMEYMRRKYATATAAATITDSTLGALSYNGLTTHSYWDGDLAELIVASVPNPTMIYLLETALAYRYQLPQTGAKQYYYLTETVKTQQVGSGANYNVTDLDGILLGYPSSNDANAWLPRAAEQPLGRRYTFIRMQAANAFTYQVNPQTGGATISGLSQVNLEAQYESITVECSDVGGVANWVIVSSGPETLAKLSALIVSASGKTTPVDTDTLALIDSADSNTLKELTWTNLKAALKTYNDTLYVGISDVREILTGDRTYYVRTDGSDSNDGSANDASHAWLTLQYSFDYIKQNIDAAGYDITVNIADGTYETSGANLSIGPLANIGRLIYSGNTSTPANVLIRSTGSWTIGLEGFTGNDPEEAINGRLHFEGFKIESDTLYGIYAESTWFTFSHLDFGDCYGDHLRIKRGAVAVPIDNYTISGDARSHIFTEYFGNFVSGDSALTVTLTGTPDFWQSFIDCEHMSGALINNITYSGSATGIRFIVGKFSSIYTANQGLTYFPGDVAGIFNGGFYDEYRDIRRQLTASGVYYVRTDGNDSNTCLVNSAAGACLTIQGAVNKWQALDTAGYDTTIYVGSGTYTGVVSLTSHTGKGNLTIYGDPSTPSNVYLNTSGTTLSLSGLGLGNIVYLEGVKIAASAGNGISVSSSKLYFQNVEFGSSSGHQMTVSDGGWIVATGNYTISAGAYTHMFAQRGGSFLPGGTIGVTISGTPAFSGAFAYSYRIGVIVYNSNYTWTGSATGTRYVASSNGIIDAAGLGTTWLPGNGAGSTSYGGQYIP